MTGTRAVSRTTTVQAPPDVVFDLLADPRTHPLIDGSGTVKATVDGPGRLHPGARFRMHMHRGVPYLMRNTVVEYVENRRIAWRHIGRHRWRYVLEPVGDGTSVTETFDYSTALSPWLYERLGYPERNARGIEATLRRLAELAESRAAAGTHS